MPSSAAVPSRSGSCPSPKRDGPIQRPKPHAASGAPQGLMMPPLKGGSGDTARDIPHRTLMRPLLVKSHTGPESGFFRFFPPGACWRSRQSVSCPDVMAVFECQPTWLPQPLLEGPGPLLGRLQSRVAGLLWALEMLPCPRTVLRKSLAAPRGRASECRARGRGRTRNRRRPSPALQEPERGCNQSRGRREKRPRRALAFPDAAGEGCEHAHYRLLPGESREAPGHKRELRLLTDADRDQHGLPVVWWCK
jgi:hypothetical protein